MSKLLDHADILQEKTKKSINRIKSNIADIDNIANSTLEELRANSEQITSTINETNQIDKKLSDAEKLKNKFALLSGQWFSFNLFTKSKKLAKTNEQANTKKPQKTHKTNGTNNDQKKIKDNTPDSHISSNTKIKSNIKIQSIKPNNTDTDLATRLDTIEHVDTQIDNSLDLISGSLDAIMEKAMLMKDEVVYQNKKLDELDGKMFNINDKQNKVNFSIGKILRGI